MTDQELATRTVEANQIELAVRRQIETSADPEERELLRSVVRQAVALRKALEGLIVHRAITAQQRDQASAASAAAGAR